MNYHLETPKNRNTPLGWDQPPALVSVGKLLKKNNVAADVVSMGETEDNQVRWDRRGTTAFCVRVEALW